MDEAFEQALRDVEQSEEKLNAQRHRLFSECERNLFFSDGYDAYEESLEQYFFTLHSKFGDETHLTKIEEGLASKDASLRRTILHIIKSGFFSAQFLGKIAPALVHLAIDGNDEDHVITIKIFARKYHDKAALLAALPGCLSVFYQKLTTDLSDSYYIYQHIGRVLRELDAKDFIDEYLRIGQHSPDPDIKEWAAEFVSAP